MNYYLNVSLIDSSTKNDRCQVVTKNSTLRYEFDETLSDECEFAARAEGE